MKLKVCDGSGVLCVIISMILQQQPPECVISNLPDLYIEECNKLLEDTSEGEEKVLRLSDLMCGLLS